MAWIVNDLQYRIIFLRHEQTPDPITGGMRSTYETLAKVWAGMQPLNMASMWRGAGYVRDVQISEYPTHKFTVRKNPSIGVTSEHNGIIKSDHFILLLNSRTPGFGRLFRIAFASEITTHGAGNDSIYEIVAKELGTFDTGRGALS